MPPYRLVYPVQCNMNVCSSECVLEKNLDNVRQMSGIDEGVQRDMHHDSGFWQMNAILFLQFAAYALILCEACAVEVCQKLYGPLRRDIPKMRG